MGVAKGRVGLRRNGRLRTLLSAVSGIIDITERFPITVLTASTISA
jgi:hypothetical protein